MRVVVVLCVFCATTRPTTNTPIPHLHTRPSNTHPHPYRFDIILAAALNATYALQPHHDLIPPSPTDGACARPYRYVAFPSPFSGGGGGFGGNGPRQAAAGTGTEALPSRVTLRVCMWPHTQSGFGLVFSSDAPPPAPSFPDHRSHNNTKTHRRSTPLPPPPPQPPPPPTTTASPSAPAAAKTSSSGTPPPSSPSPSTRPRRKTTLPPPCSVGPGRSSRR